MAKAKVKKQEVEATHELIDGEVLKVDLVERPATGDLWLAARSKEAAQEIIKQGDWAMRTAIAAEQVARDDTHEIVDDQPLTVALDIEEIDREEDNTDQKPGVVERIGAAAAPLTRDDVRDAINEIVPGVVAQTLRALGLVQESVPAAEPATVAQVPQSEPEPTSEPVERAGAKMSGKRLKRFSAALTSIQQGIVTLGDIHRELGGGDKKGGVKREGDFNSDFLTSLIVDQMRTFAAEQSSQVEAAIKREVGGVNARIDKIQAASVKPSSVPVDKTDEVQRTKKKKDTWSEIVRGRETQY